MTTVFAIKHPAIDSAILVADRQTTSINQQTGLPRGKHLQRKLWVSKDGNFCFGHAGGISNDTYKFIEKLREGGFDIERITKKGYFPELRRLNLKEMGRRVPDSQKISGLILATRFDKDSKLYTCFPLGEVEERVWTTVGSGEQKVQEYLHALQVRFEAEDYVISEKDPTIEDAIRVGLEAVRRAQSQDIYSHGLDMLVCTPKGIRDHYEDLGDDFARKLKRIQRQYRKK